MRNKALFQLGKLLDQKGEELLPRYVRRGSLITPEQVFERLIVGLLDGMVRVDRLDRGENYTKRGFSPPRDIRAGIKRMGYPDPSGKQAGRSFLLGHDSGRGSGH